MKLGFYDSGLGGLSVLREFVEKYQSRYSYVYFGDSARAPYGTKSPEQLKSYVVEIADYMQEKEVDVLISACNSSSMYLAEIDFDDYFFQVISLNDVMTKHFAETNYDEQVALLATQATIDSGRYIDWNVDIHPVACTDLVPAVEAGDLELGRERWQAHLEQLPEDIKQVIIGCTHYAFLTSEVPEGSLRRSVILSPEGRQDPIASQDDSYKYIDPAKLVLEQFEASIFDDGLLNYQCKKDQEIELDIYFSKSDSDYINLAMSLIA